LQTKKKKGINTVTQGMHLSDTFLNLRNTADQPEVIVEYREETSHHSTGNSFSELLQ